MPLLENTALEFETACNHIRDNIAYLLSDVGRPSHAAVSLAAQATRDIADALHHASGNPDDARWYAALSSLERFIGECERSPRAVRTRAFAELRSFLDENVVAA